MEDHTTTDSTLRILAEVRKDFPSTGAVLQSYLRRTEADCRDLATAGSRVRLCKGAYEEPAAVAYKDRAEVDRSYVRCLDVLMAGAGRPMVATHDPRLIAIAAGPGRGQRARRSTRTSSRCSTGSARTSSAGWPSPATRSGSTRPYGVDWYGYFMRRLAERPANVAFFLRALATRS